MEKITDGLKQTTQAFSSMMSWGMFPSALDDIVSVISNLFNFKKKERKLMEF
jgi:hypothetical protein